MVVKLEKQENRSGDETLAAQGFGSIAREQPPVVRSGSRPGCSLQLLQRKWLCSSERLSQQCGSCPSQRIL